MNSKGFTLVELLAMMLVLGVLMAVAVPNVTGILANNKLNVMKADATKMVDTAKLKFSRITANERPRANQCVIYALNYLNDTGDITDGPNGGSYMQFDSFIIVKRSANQYDYYIRLIETAGSKKVGMNLVERSVLSEGETDYIKEIPADKILGLAGDKEADMAVLNANADIRAKCPSGVVDYYPGKILR